MNSFFKDIGTIERMKNGPLGCHISAYAEKLHGQGFSWQSGRRKLQLAADFSRWLKRNGVVASQVRAKHVGKYLQFRRRSGFDIQLGDPPAVTGFLKFLRDQRVTEERLPKAIITPCQRWLGEYDGYLQKERALSPATRINYGPFVRRFLVSRFGRGRVEFSKLRAPDVLKFVRRQASQLKTKRVLLMVSAVVGKNVIGCGRAREMGLLCGSCPVQ